MHNTRTITTAFFMLSSHSNNLPCTEPKLYLKAQIFPKGWQLKQPTDSHIGLKSLQHASLQNGLKFVARVFTI